MTQIIENEVEEVDWNSMIKKTMQTQIHGFPKPKKLALKSSHSCDVASKANKFGLSVEDVESIDKENRERISNMSQEEINDLLESYLNITSKKEKVEKEVDDVEKGVENVENVKEKDCNGDKDDKRCCPLHETCKESSDKLCFNEKGEISGDEDDYQPRNIMSYLQSRVPTHRHFGLSLLTKIFENNTKEVMKKFLVDHSVLKFVVGLLKDSNFMVRSNALKTFLTIFQGCKCSKYTLVAFESMYDVYFKNIVRTVLEICRNDTSTRPTNIIRFFGMLPVTKLSLLEVNMVLAYLFETFDDEDISYVRTLIAFSSVVDKKTVHEELNFHKYILSKNTNELCIAYTELYYHLSDKDQDDDLIHALFVTCCSIIKESHQSNDNFLVMRIATIYKILMRSHESTKSLESSIRHLLSKNPIIHDAVFEFAYEIFGLCSKQYLDGLYERVTSIALEDYNEELEFLLFNDDYDTIATFIDMELSVNRFDRVSSVISGLQKGKRFVLQGLRLYDRLKDEITIEKIPLVFAIMDQDNFKTLLERILSIFVVQDNNEGVDHVDAMEFLMKSVSEIEFKNYEYWMYEWLEKVEKDHEIVLVILTLINAIESSGYKHADGIYKYQALSSLFVNCDLWRDEALESYVEELLIRLVSSGCKMSVNKDLYESVIDGYSGDSYCDPLFSLHLIAPVVVNGEYFEQFKDAVCDSRVYSLNLKDPSIIPMQYQFIKHLLV
jgi:hypothetical protein